MNFVNIENKAKKILARFPKTRRFFKGIYHRIFYTISKDKTEYKGNIVRISPMDDYEYFFGYYDKSPWDVSDRYVIALQVKNAYKIPDSVEEAKIVVFDTENNNKMEFIGTTHCWNTQQGCMAQWLAPDFKSKIIYNDFRNGKYVSVVYNFETKKEEKVYDMPIYDIAKDGKFALTLDFSRLHRLRKGYGYANLKETTEKELCPDKACIWKIDLKTGNISEVIKYTDLASFEVREEMIGAEHKVNHIMISPNGKRFMVLHRWFKNHEKFTRLLTMNVDGTDMYNLSDDDFVSHCCWKNDGEILSFLRKKDTGDHYYLMKDKTTEYKMLWPELNTDGHCTYSSDSKYIITDTYPNRKRMASLYLCRENKEANKIAMVFAPFKYDNDVRCDLHPRWNHKNNNICIDSVHEGKKEIYIININKSKKIENDKKEPLVSIIIPYYNAMSTIFKTLESVYHQFYKNIEVIIVNDGSNDNLKDCVDYKNYLKKIKIKYIEKENGGVSSARNVGIENASGKYFIFLDSDDVISKNYLSKCISICENENIDTVISNQDRNIDRIIESNLENQLNDYTSNRNDGLSYFMYNKEKIHFGGIIYRKEIIDKIGLRFELNTKYGEDLEFAWKYLLNCKKMYITNDKTYGYYDNPNSAVNTTKWEKTDLIKAMNRVSNYMKKRNDEFLSLFEGYMLPRTYWTTLKTFAIGKRMDYFNKFIEEYPVKINMEKLSKNAKNKKLKISSKIYLLNKQLFYICIIIIYKIFKKTIKK